MLKPAVSTVAKLFDDESTRKKFTVMNMGDVLFDDSRNNNRKFWYDLDDYLEWGKCYRLTFEEITEEEWVAENFPGTPWYPEERAERKYS